MYRPIKDTEVTSEVLSLLSEAGTVFLAVEGPRGLQGPQGPQGIQGEVGPVGPQGPQGNPGRDGAIKIVPVNELPTENIEEGVMYLLRVAETGNRFQAYVYIEGAWEPFEQVELGGDLTEYVKFTDYATESKAGVIIGSTTFGYGISTGGALLAKPLSLSEYKNKSFSLFISKGTLEDIKYDYVMRALSEYQVAAGETSIWTDEDKAKACETIGAVQRRPNMDHGWNRVYGMDASGEEVVHRVANGIQANTIAIRGVNGVVMCGTPSGDHDAVPKKYAEDNFVAKQTKALILYGTDSDGNQTTWTLRNTNNTKNTIAGRDSNGNIQVGSAINATDATNKEYVENLPDKLTLTDEQKAKWRAFIGSAGVKVLTQAEYDALETKEENLVYIISDSPDALETIQAIIDGTMAVPKAKLLELGDEFETSGYTEENVGLRTTFSNEKTGLYQFRLYREGVIYDLGTLYFDGTYNHKLLGSLSTAADSGSTVPYGFFLEAVPNGSTYHVYVKESGIANTDWITSTTKIRYRKIGV